MKLPEAVQGLSLAARNAFGTVDAAIADLIVAARTSDLTGLPNATALDEDFSEIQVSEVSYHVMFGDLNGFKQINDSYDHAAGDAALRWTGTLLKTAVQNWEATAYHKSGDEFVVLVASAHKQRLIDELCQYFKHIALPFEYGENEVVLDFSGSFGCAEVGTMDLSSALRAAESACQIAKHSGRECVVHEWSPHDEVGTVEKRFRCDACGTSVRCTVTVEHRDAKTLKCPVCNKDAAVGQTT